MKDARIFRTRSPLDHPWITGVAKKLWGSHEIISRDRTYNLLAIQSVVAEENGRAVGFIMYANEGKECEIVALYSAVEKQGIATKLIDLVRDAAKKSDIKRVWLMTTNDNTQALRFYQKRGFTIAAFRPNVIEAQRKLKPIPILGNDGIPIRDEIELEIFTGSRR